MKHSETGDRSRSYPALALISAAILWLVGCTASETPPQSGSGPAAVPAGAADPEPAVTDAENLDGMVEIARKDLARRLAVDIDSIARVDARSVTWASGANGCPRPGMNYTQALVPGLLIVLQVGEERFAYHAGSGTDPVYCPADRAERPVEESVLPGM